MKNQLLLIGLIFTMFVAYSQTTQTKSDPQPTVKTDSVADPKDEFCPHRILVNFGGGYANNMFKNLNKEANIATRCSYTVMAEVGYTYFFHRNVGIGIGVGINHVGRSAKINEHNTYYNLVDPLYPPNANEIPYDLTYKVLNLKQRQTVWAIEIPLTIQFEKKFGGRNGIYAGAGVKGYFPIASKFGYPKGTIELPEMYEPYFNWWCNKLDVHLDPMKVQDKSMKVKMAIGSIDVLGEFGGIFGISRGTDLYLGLYASYGFLNILPKGGIKFDNLNVIDPRLSLLADRYANRSDKWNLLQVGLKLGFHFLPCKSCGNDEYMRDQKRRYMDEMMKKKNEPVVITNTVQEYYYFVPTVSQELLDETANNPDKKKAVTELAQSLANIKILFDLDKDIPKLDDYKRDFIMKASEILKKNPDLKVVITGYTSPEGTREHNIDLGHRRALAVREIFINKHGVPADQIAVQNFTAEEPQHKIDIPEKEYPEQRAVIFRIEKR